MLIIECCGWTAITVKADLPKLAEFINQLNNIYKDFIKLGSGLYEQKKKICDKWDSFMSDIKEIQNDYTESGIPLKGTCDVCKKTKEAKSLMPPN